MGTDDIENSLKCHHFSTGISATSKFMGEFETGILAHDGVKLRESQYTFWVLYPSTTASTTLPST